MITAQELKEKRKETTNIALAFIEGEIRSAENRGSRTCVYFLKANDNADDISKSLRNYGFTATYEPESDPRDVGSRGLIRITWE